MLESPLNVPKSNWRNDEEMDIFSDAVGQFFEKECAPHVPAWRKAGVVPREIWTKAGEMGLLCASVPEEYGGASMGSASRCTTRSSRPISPRSALKSRSAAGCRAWRQASSSPPSR